jgi:hypothetical protein
VCWLFHICYGSSTRVFCFPPWHGGGEGFFFAFFFSLRRGAFISWGGREGPTSLLVFSKSFCPNGCVSARFGHPFETLIRAHGGCIRRALARSFPTPHQKKGGGGGRWAINGSHVYTACWIFPPPLAPPHLMRNAKKRQIRDFGGMDGRPHHNGAWWCCRLQSLANSLGRSHAKRPPNPPIPPPPSDYFSGWRGRTFPHSPSPSRRQRALESGRRSCDKHSTKRLFDGKAISL